VRLAAGQLSYFISGLQSLDKIIQGKPPGNSPFSITLTAPFSAKKIQSYYKKLIFIND